MDPIFVVLLYSSLSAGAAALGAGPFVWRRRLPVAAMGWANALAAGMMLGAAYVLLVAGLARETLPLACGAALGIGFVWWTHAAAGTEELSLNRLDDPGAAYGYQVLLANVLHSASEGVAIGAAMALSLPFGIFVALAITVQNIPEGTVLCAVLTGRGVSSGHAAGLAVVANVTQVLLAIVTFAIVEAADSLLPWALGFAVGALVQLVMAELLPESYRQAGRRTIALVAIVAMGMVVFLETVTP
jgi:ZIP family zinc transporter